MQTNWKLSSDGLSASRTLDNGATESRLLSVISPTELALAIPAYTVSEALNSAKTEKLSALSSACASQIYAGFSSAALGTAYAYPAKDKDQSNLVASVTASLMPNLPAGWTTNFWCADGTGAWAFRPHTAAQIQKVGLDGKTAIEAALQKNATLAAQVTAASTVAAVQAIVW